MGGARNAKNEVKNTERAVSTYTELLSAIAKVNLLQGEQLGRFELTTSQFGMLQAVVEGGPLSLTEIGERIFCTESNAAVVAGNLERRGLIVRRPDGVDRRRVSVHLTPEGRALASRAYPQYARVVRAQMAALSGAQQETLQRLCQKLGEGDAVRFAREMMKVDDWER